MALVIIIIHCLLVLLSSACFLSSCFVVPPHVGATWHAYQLSLGCSESTGSGGRRLVNSPEAAERSRRLRQNLKARVGTKHSEFSCHSQNPQRVVGIAWRCRLNCREVLMSLTGQFVCQTHAVDLR